jgi:hypothetical protein
MARSTRGLLAEYEGELKFETGWLYFHADDIYLRGHERRLWVYKRATGHESVCCTTVIHNEYVIPRGVRRISLVFSTHPDEGVLGIEAHMMQFVRIRLRDSLPDLMPDPNRVWYWSVAYED